MAAEPLPQPMAVCFVTPGCPLLVYQHLYQRYLAVHLPAQLQVQQYLYCHHLTYWATVRSNSHPRLISDHLLLPLHALHLLLLLLLLSQAGCLRLYQLGPPHPELQTSQPMTLCLRAREARATHGEPHSFIPECAAQQEHSREYDTRKLTLHVATQAWVYVRHTSATAQY
jgi:hypothetical protein